MSVNRYAQLILGSVVQREDIFDQEKTLPGGCCKHCSYFAGQQLKFCGECGQSLLPTLKTTWKPNVLRVLQRTDRYCEAERVERQFFEAPMFDISGLLIVGVQLARVRESPRKPTVLDLATVEKGRTEVLALLADMGISEREICLFPHVFVC